MLDKITFVIDVNLIQIVGMQLVSQSAMISKTDACGHVSKALTDVQHYLVLTVKAIFSISQMQLKQNK